MNLLLFVKEMTYFTFGTKNKLYRMNRIEGKANLNILIGFTVIGYETHPAVKMGGAYKSFSKVFRNSERQYSISVFHRVLEITGNILNDLINRQGFYFNFHTVLVQFGSRGYPNDLL